MKLELEETSRQILAGAVASALFLLGYFQLSLALWAALILAALGYASALIAVARRPEASRRMVATDVSEAELSTAIAMLGESAERLMQASAAAPPHDQPVFHKMATILSRIQAHHRADPQDVRHTRRFLRHDLPRLVETAETYVELSARADANESERLAGLSEVIASMTPALEKIERACLDNDFLRLEVETEVLSGQLGRR